MPSVPEYLLQFRYDPVHGIYGVYTSRNRIERNIGGQSRFYDVMLVVGR